MIKCTVVLDVIDNSNAHWKRNGSLTIPVQNIIPRLEVMGICSKDLDADI